MYVSIKDPKIDKKQEHMCGRKRECAEGADYSSFCLLLYSVYFI